MKELLDIFEGMEIADDGTEYLSRATDPGAVARAIKEALHGSGEVTFEEVFEKVTHEVNVPRKELFMVLRVVITGRTNGPPLKDMFRLIPRGHILERIRWLDQKLSSH
jgi:glutamyl/glutaminyl-tRNA synthetase